MSDARDLNDLRATTVHGVRWVMLSRPVVEGVLVSSMVALARLIPPAEFGHFASASLISGFAVASLAAISIALVQRPELEREHVQAATALALIAGAALVGLTLVAANVVAVPIFGNRTAQIVRLSAPGALVAAVGAVPTAVLQRRLAFRRISIMEVTGTIFQAAVSVALAVAGLNAEALVLGALAGITVQTAMACIWAPPVAPRPRRRALRDVLHNGAPNWLAGVSWVGFSNCDYAIVGARLGALQAGFYFRAYTLGVVYQKKISRVMDSVGLPVLARTRTGEEMDELRGQMVSLLTVVLFPCLALLAILAPVAIPWVFGANWRPAVAPTQLLAIGGAATIVIDAAGTTLMAAGRSRAILGFGWAHFIAYAIAVFFSASYGLTAVAAAAAAVHTGFVFVAYALMNQSAGRQVWARIWKDVAPAICSCAALVAAGVLASLAMSSISDPPLLNITAVSLAGGCAYTAVLRTCFSRTWRTMANFVSHLVPGNVRRWRSSSRSVDALPVSASAEN
jgi:lipopolysaccharide exporter